MSSLTLVTGATGFIGQRVIRKLVQRGESVRVLVRRPQLLPTAIAGRVEIVQGDIRDRSTLERAVAGSHTIIHLAACARAWSPDPREFSAVNVEAVDMLLDASEHHHVRRIVHVSTVLTLSRPGSRALTPYEATKIAGERLMDRSGCAIIVHPTRVYGAGPLNDANGVTRLIAAYLSGRFRVRLDDGDVQANYVHADDVADGILLSARHGTVGAHYALHGENASLRTLLAMVARISGKQRRVFAVAPAAVIAAAGAAEWCGRIGLPVPITRDWVRLFLEDQRVLKDTTATLTDYAPRPLEAGLSDTISWLRATQGRPQ
jgi:nucleoside-diphosphate-sugar epimerase